MLLVMASNTIPAGTAARYAELAKQHKISDQDLADALGISRHAAYRRRRGEAKFDPDELPGVARLLCISVDELTGGAA